MALAKSSSAAIVILFMMMSILCGVSMSTKKVNLDSDGWTITDDDDYEVPVNVGDSIVFEYDNKCHNVNEVALEDYNTCNAASPSAQYTSGNDTLTFDKPGNYYFICGFPDHCQNGEKVIIKTVENPEPPVMAPKLSTSGNSPSTASSGRKIAPPNKSK